MTNREDFIIIVALGVKRCFLFEEYEDNMPLDRANIPSFPRVSSIGRQQTFSGDD